MNIAFITRELEGVDKNGGIGIATRYICEHLARKTNHTIYLYHTGYSTEKIDDISQNMTKLCIKFYTIHIDAPVYHSEERRPYQVYRELKKTNHDIYIFHDYLADGFFCFLAKESGIAFLNAKLGLISHSSSLWCDQANRQFPDSESRLSLYDMERACVELADFLVSPSKYLLGWMQEQGWKLPKNTRCIPNLVSSPGSFAAQTSSKVLPPEEVRELVFFGRREERKGVRVFCEALNLLPLEILSGRIITFLGSECGYDEQNINNLLKPILEQSKCSLQFITDYDSLKARAYLQKTGRCAIMPSLIDNSPCVVYECLENHIPFLASSVGGGIELICDEDREAVTFVPEKKVLADALKRCLTSGIQISCPSYTHESLVLQWMDLLVDLQGVRLVQNAPSGTSRPMVSMILVHHNRPQLLKYSLQSCLDQDYPNLEILLVDDGSDEPEALAYLDELENKRLPRVKILRRENRYLGAARNAGIAESTGEYAVFLDDDNIALPDMVSRYVDAALYSGADAVSGAMTFFHEQQGSPIKEIVNNELHTFWGSHQHYSAMLVNHLGDATGIYRMSVLRHIGGFHEKYGVTHEDYKMYIDIETAGYKIVAIPDVMFLYRVIADSMFRTTNLYMNAQQHLMAYSCRLSCEFIYLPIVLFGINEARKNLILQYLQQQNIITTEPSAKYCIFRLIKICLKVMFYRIIDIIPMTRLREQCLYIGVKTARRLENMIDYRK
jgi:glycosyltransferase involved in cell wall biosynthesis